ncbi:pentatricopeptide repeat-containing protein, putative [Ricinus communis]|uniref:Pentatricopeptide repeat-containing protein, putative n=1 Tax=Ricinus communis TaxID=3988 RepID=B9RFL6_RICCO|nr:pentatricopeptide repeat-containing protein, putative [Ricinus communis]
MKSYFEKGLVREARNVFDEMLERDVVAWTVMIAGYASCNEHAYAWSMFCDMVASEMNPNAFTISSVLKACKGMKSLSCGTLVHGFAIKHGIEGSIFVDNALMDAYATCCVSMREACLVFCGIEVKNAVSWTTLIAGYTHKGDGHLGLQIFRQMLLEEEECNPYSFSIAVRACASIGSHNFGKQIHAAVIKHGCEFSLPVMNSILDMYCRCGRLPEANQYFHEMTRRDLITWNTIIAGYERSDSIEALFIFSEMKLNGFDPDCNTFTSVTAACANLAVLSCGQQVHGGIIQKGLDKDLILANALIDMYAKCGIITDSRKIFSELSCKNLVSWTSMMIGYGAHGFGREVVELFDEMVESGIKPDHIAFMAVLSACSHAGLVDQGLRLRA